MTTFNQFQLVFKKEALSLSRDRRSLVISIMTQLFLFPSLLLFIGYIQQIQTSHAEQVTITVGVKQQDQSNEFVQFLKTQQQIKLSTKENLTAALKKSEVLGVVEVQSKADLQGDTYQNIVYLFDESNNDSEQTSGKIAGFFEQFSTKKREQKLTALQLSEKKLVPFDFSTDTLQARAKTSSGALLAFLLPYMMILVSVQGTVHYALEMTVGEKERSTLATTLLLNVRPSIIAFAKISLTLLLSTLMLVLQVSSLLITFTVFHLASSLSVSLNFIQALQIMVVMLPFTLLMSSLMILLGMLARNTKEGTTYALPLSLLAIVMSFMSSLFDTHTPLFVFLIPIISQVAVLKQILIGSFIWQNVVLITISCLLALWITVSTVSKMFSKEAVLFRV